MSTSRMPGQLYPAGQKVLMRYADELDLVDTGTGIATHQYRLNSIFDPDFSLGGHQPLSYDQWAALYRQYLVYGVKATVNAVANGDAATLAIPSTVVLTLTNSNASINDINTAMEYPNSKIVKLGPNESGQRTLKTGYIDLAQYAGFKGLRYDQSEWGAAFGANPTNEFYLQIGAFADDGTTVSVNLNIVLDYYVFVFEPADLTAS